MMHNVGYMEGITADPERHAWQSEEPRPLAWAAWYPASANAVATEKLLGPPGNEIFRMDAVASGADLSHQQDRWPIVLLSHGTGGSAHGLCWLGCYLASRGYIAVGVSHHGNTAIEPYLAEGFMCWWERARDLTVILDWAAGDGPHAGRVDLSNVFAAGFSLGGYTVLSLAGAVSDLTLFQTWLDAQGDLAGGPREFPDLADRVPELLAHSEPFRQSMERHGRSYHDSRVKAVAALAPAPPVRAFTPASLSSIVVPVHIMTGEADAEAPHEDCSLWLKRQNPAFDVTLLGANVGHYVFLPEATETGRRLEPLICRDPDDVDRRAIHDRCAMATETLFRRVINRGR